MSIAKIFFNIAEKNKNLIAQIYKNDKEYFKVTYGDLKKDVLKFASFLNTLGIRSQDKIVIFSENRPEWTVIDFAILSLGAVDVPKGADVTNLESEYIINSVSPNVIIIENLALLKLLSKINLEVKPSTIIVLDDIKEEDKSIFPSSKVFSYKECILLGDASRIDSKIYEITNSIKDSEMATIIYTSGTTGNPKGVMLSHSNFIYQVSGFKKMIETECGQISMCILPIWHSFQRSFSYNVFLSGLTCLFSTVVPRIILEDLKNTNPHYLTAVPRLWIAIKQNIFKEVAKKSFVAKSIFHFFIKVAILYDISYRIILGLYPDNGFDIFYPFKKILGLLGLVLLSPFKFLGNFLVFNKIKKVLGKNFVVGITGGGSLPMDVARFFNAIGIELANAYGLTEASPGIASNAHGKSIIGTAGKILPGTIAEIRNEEGIKLRKPGKGILFAKGPQIMLGYYLNEEATKQIIGEDGFLNTGDIVHLSKDDVVQIIGRAKDTIVLNNGENIEPAPIEIKLEESVFIEKAVVVGQDQKFLGALILPNYDEIVKYLKNIGQIFDENNRHQIIENNVVLKAINDEITKLVNKSNGFKPFEQIIKFYLLEKPFEIGKEISIKMDIRRNYILNIYQKEIKNLFA